MYTIKPGDEVFHLKRHTIYRVVALVSSYLTLRDNEYAVLQAEPLKLISEPDDIVELCLPVLIQQSIPTNNLIEDWIVYQQSGGPRFFARPRREFTPDRFLIIKAPSEAPFS